MCNIYERVNKECMGGWKVVLQDWLTGDYVSPATGLNYTKRKSDRLPRMKTAKRITYYFTPDVVMNCFNEGMQGKTAIFVSRLDALTLARSIAECFTKKDREKYRLMVVYAEVHGEVYRGDYDHAPVFIGTRIRFVEPPKAFKNIEVRVSPHVTDLKYRV